MIRRNIWFYRDRTGLPRGPMTIDTVKKCWIGGIIDEHTLVWGNGLGDWVPLRNIRGMGHVLNDPRTRFLKWITQKVAFPRAEVRANRDRLYEEGKAASPVMKSREEVAAWKAAREERARAEREAREEEEQVRRRDESMRTIGYQPRTTR